MPCDIIPASDLFQFHSVKSIFCLVAAADICNLLPVLCIVRPVGGSVHTQAKNSIARHFHCQYHQTQILWQDLNAFNRQ